MKENIEISLNKIITNETNMNKKNVSNDENLNNENLNNDIIHLVNINETNMKQTIKCCNQNIYIKRLSLPLIGLIGLFTMDNVVNYINVPLIIFIVSISIFWNFPKLIIFTNSKPFYYEDLFVDTSHIKLLDINPKIKRKPDKPTAAFPTCCC